MIPVPSKGYRPDIDGLRALAVVLVVLFHVGFGWFPGGYVGVDVFFVISGFLITGLLVSELAEHGRVDLKYFYLRRLRRLFPALLSTVILSVVAGMILFPTYHMKSLAESASFAILSVSNIFFWAQSGYFDTDSTLKPLLHTWSLSVEEQFYYVWPVTLVLASRFRLLLPAVLLVTFLSFGANFIFYDASDQSTIFYLTPFRMFELGIGGLLVWGVRYRLNAFFTELLVPIGFALILFSAVEFDNTTVFPAHNALVPCFGAAILLYSGQSRYAGILLRNPISVFIGVISYSLYLVHWPIIVFYRYYTFADFSNFEKASIVVASLIASCVSYFFIERPLRRPKVGWNRRFVYGAGAVASLLLVFAVSTYAADGWHFRRPGEISQAMISSNTADYENFFNAATTCKAYMPSPACKPNGKKRILIVGDSHELIWAKALVERYGDQAQFVLFGSYNYCLFTFADGKAKPASSKNNCDAKAAVLNDREFLSNIDTVLLASYRPFSYGANVFRGDLLRHIAGINEHARIVILGTYYNTRVDCRDIVDRFRDINACGRPDMADPQISNEPGKKRYFANLNYTYLDVSAALCTGGKCPWSADGYPMAFDKNHWTVPFGAFALATIEKNRPDMIRAMGLEPVAK